MKHKSVIKSLLFPAIFITLYVSAAAAQPAIWFVSPTLGNQSVSQEDWIYVNVSTDDAAGSCLLEWNPSGTTAKITGQGNLADIYYIEEFASDEHRGIQSKWDISRIPAGSRITNATVCYLVCSANNVGMLDNDVSIWRVANQTWNEGITAYPGQFGGMPLTNAENTTIPGHPLGNDDWFCIDLTEQLNASYEAGDDNFTARLEDPDSHISNFNGSTDDSDLWFGNFSSYYELNDREDSCGSGAASLPYVNVTYVEAGPDVSNYTMSFTDNGNMSAWRNMTSLLNDSYYYFRVYCNNTAGSLNVSGDREISVSVQTPASLYPVLVSMSPANGNISRDMDVNFTCSASDDEMLASISFNMWNSAGSLYYSNTRTVTGKVNSGYWFLQTITPDTYKWNCRACDNASRCTQQSQNYSIKVALVNSLYVKLVLNNTNSMVYVPGAGAVSSGSLSNQTYDSPAHYYVASYLNSVLSGLVFSRNVPRTVAVGREAGTHYIALNQDMENSEVFLVFTYGDWASIQSRIALIEAQQFMTHVLPSFSYGLGNKYLLELALSYQDVDLRGGLRLQTGSHNVIIENNGTYAGRPVVVLRRG